MNLFEFVLLQASPTNNERNEKVNEQKKKKKGEKLLLNDVYVSSE